MDRGRFGQVDGVVFRVLAHLLAPSQFFHGLLYINATTSTTRSSTAQSYEPYSSQHLPDVTAEEFRDFYRVLEAAPYR